MNILQDLVIRVKDETSQEEMEIIQDSLHSFLDLMGGIEIISALEPKRLALQGYRTVHRKLGDIRTMLRILSHHFHPDFSSFLRLTERDGYETDICYEVRWYKGKETSHRTGPLVPIE